MKYCVDCVHREFRSGGDACKANRHLVTGTPLMCDWMRLEGGACGPEGKQFKAKPPTESAA